MTITAYSNATDVKWQRRWEETKLYAFNEANIGRKHYLLEMFSYPSGKNLHIGHWWNYSLSDSYGRLKRMQGYEVFHPPGFDAFGLPAENFAIKSGIHPEESTKDNIARMGGQFLTMGTTYDWGHLVVTCEPEYYRWSQWLFLRLFERGLAYRKEAPVNWCPSCMTVLANEQVVDGRCERCEGLTAQKRMTQWFFRITEYADELLNGLAVLDWPEKTKKIQENWIGRTLGCEVDFPIEADRVTAYTTRVDTLMGVTYVVLAPEHPMVDALTLSGHRDAVRDYQAQAGRRSEMDRISSAKEKSGVFTGSYAAHPMTGRRLPIWVADYVLASHGTGAVMAVPAHDLSDHAFALRYGLPIVPVIGSPLGPGQSLPYCEDGVLFGGTGHDGLTSGEARIRITAELEASGLGRAARKYRLRDWLVSRQRYWGTPIPIVHCEGCGHVPVPEGELPLRLPHDVEFLPNGRSPLAACEPFVSAPCPRCGRPAKRETDTLDTFVCSSWYFLRFLDNRDMTKAFDSDRINKLMPVDKYVGGIEHAAMHLLYARFITKALRDMGFLRFDEPFASLVHQGFILDADGRKMSKRSGAVSPDGIVKAHGADVFRLYLGFGFSFTDGGFWNDDGIKAVERFVRRVCRAVDCYVGSISRDTDGDSPEDLYDGQAPADMGLERLRHDTIKQVTEDIDGFRFNTAIARIMELLNGIARHQARPERDRSQEGSAVRDMVLLLAPLAPHLAEELWCALGNGYSVHNQEWPAYDPNILVREMAELAVQVNGTLRGVIMVPTNADDASIREAALGDPKVIQAIGGREVRKAIVVKGRLINFVLL
ncbi:MAG: leucine--tRNA ligase [Oscillospiraceae bacterium]|nr:leucine--tRNA ligase [Oscillospiraceae bacterium]